jgi:Ribonuclease G/E
MRLIFSGNDQIFKEYFSRVLSACQAGLAGENARAKDADEEIEWLQQEITNYRGNSLRHRYLMSCLLWTLVFFFLIELVDLSSANITSITVARQSGRLLATIRMDTCDTAWRHDCRV